MFPRQSLDLLQAEVLGGFVKFCKHWEFSFSFQDWWALLVSAQGTSMRCSTQLIDAFSFPGGRVQWQHRGTGVEGEQEPG